jgi:hypothetical protein
MEPPPGIIVTAWAPQSELPSSDERTVVVPLLGKGWLTHPVVAANAVSKKKKLHLNTIVQRFLK